MKNVPRRLVPVALAFLALGACTVTREDVLRTTPAMDAWLRAGQPAISDHGVQPPRAPVQNDAPDASAAVREDGGSTLTGRVTDIDRDAGHVTIRTPEGRTIQLVVPPYAIARMRAGDDVALDVRVSPSRR